MATNLRPQPSTGESNAGPCAGTAAATMTVHMNPPQHAVNLECCLLFCILNQASGLSQLGCGAAKPHFLLT